MTYTEAHNEFCVRLYRWAKTALEKEIYEGFPSFQQNNDWSTLRCRFIQSLDPASKIEFAQGILQMRHQNAAKAMGTSISTEAAALMRREEAFRSKNIGCARVASSEIAVGDLALATRREIKKAIGFQFRAAFGDECLKLDPLDRKSDLRSQMGCRGWIITTDFEFGRWEPEINCVHNVWTGKLITKEEPQVLFANCLGFQLNYGNELGLGSGWDEITVKDIEAKCASVIDHCRRMFDIFPILLNGLDLELLST